MVQDFSLQEKIGKNLKSLLKQRNLTQEEFAELCLVEPRTVRKWIQNGIDKISTIELIAKVLEMKVEDVMCL